MLLPEWCPQKGILMAWPDSKTDWSSNLAEAESCYRNIINAIIASELVFLICRNEAETKNKLTGLQLDKITFIEAEYNDTWARDFGPIGIQKADQSIKFIDFGFNGWGKKFSATNDNALNRQLCDKGIIPNLTDLNSFILEGGSIETEGKGTLLSTIHCLTAPHRNQPMTLKDIENYLTEHLGLDHFLWLDQGYLAGDDTDSHIDTLARFCDEETICYVSISDPNDEHYLALKAMENQLKTFKDKTGKPFRLVPLPMADVAFGDDGERLPATYANFLITNDKVLVPTYNSAKDQKALKILSGVFPKREIVGIDCNVLIKQHGSLHCITMQLPDLTA